MTRQLVSFILSVSLYRLQIKCISIYKLGDVGLSSNLIGSLSLTNEQLFTEVEVNRPGYTGLFTDTEVNNYLNIYQTSKSVK